MTVRKFGSVGLVAVAAAAHCAGVKSGTYVVWTLAPPATGLGVAGATLSAQNWLRSAAGRYGLLSGMVTDDPKTPDGAMMVSTVFFENRARV